MVAVAVAALVSDGVMDGWLGATWEQAASPSSSHNPGLNQKRFIIICRLAFTAS